MKRLIAFVFALFLTAGTASAQFSGVTFVGNNNFINGNAITDVSIGDVTSNYSALEQVGDGNEASIEQVNTARWNVVELDQNGGNYADIGQDGQRLVTKAVQGSDSYLEASSYGVAHDVAVRQEHNMHAEIYLEGYNNEVALGQYGSSNKATVDVLGSGSQRNDVGITQDGMGNMVTGPSGGPGVFIQGSSNNVEIMQSSDFNQSTVTVNGSHNTATVVQQ